MPIRRAFIRRVIACSLGTVMAVVVASVPARARSIPAAAVNAATGTEGEAPAQAGALQPGATTRFLSEVWTDHKRFFCVETALWLGVGGAALAA